MDELAIFAKYWEPGQVKTRLAAAIGARPPASVSLALPDRPAATPGGFGRPRRSSRYTPAERRDEFAALAGDAWSLRLQGDGDLGCAAGTVLHRSVSARCRADRRDRLRQPHACPRRTWRKPSTLLRERPVVLGPTHGRRLLSGGGVRQQVPPIFTGIAWGSPAVWQQTVQRLHQAGRPFAELPEWYDVDEVDDLVRLRQELEVSRTWTPP